MAKEIISATIDKDAADYARELTAKDKWDRSFSKVIDILIKMGIEVTKKKKK